ncbi:MAG TPA: MFS transporter [Gammaproteobacteria bacterium]|nr:MFS transporter [Gammaproteobacteria bacterium]
MKPDADPEPAESPAKRRGFVYASYAFLATMFGTTLPTPLYPLYRHEFGLSQLMITVIYAVYAAGVIGALIFAGRWSDQLGRRRVMFAALGFSAASALVFLAAGDIALLFLGRVLSGISAGIVTGTATVMIVELAPPKRRARATLVAAAVNMGGLGLGPLVAGTLAQYAPLALRLSFLVDLALLAFAFLAVIRVPETVQIAAQPRLGAQRLHVPPEVRAAFIPACIAGFAGFAVMGLFSAVAPAFLARILGLSNLLLAGLTVFTIFATSILGQLALEWIPRDRALAIGCLILAAGAGLVGAGIGAASLALLFAGAAVSGFGQGLSFRAGLAAISARSPADRRAEITSSFFVVLYVALSLPVIGLGIAAASVGLRIAGVAFAIAVGILALVALLALWRVRPTDNTRRRADSETD